MGIEYRDEMMDFHTSTEANRTSVAGAMWQNVGRPVQANNSRKFLQQASEDELRIFESVAGDALDRLGYERVYVAAGEEQQFDADTLAAFDQENKDLKAAALQRAEPEDLVLRRPQAELLAGIDGRLSGREAALLGLGRAA